VASGLVSPGHRTHALIPHSTYDPDLRGGDLTHDLAQAVCEAPDQGLGREGLEADVARADKLEVWQQVTFLGAGVVWMTRRGCG